MKRWAKSTDTTGPTLIVDGKIPAIQLLDSSRIPKPETIPSQSRTGQTGEVPESLECPETDIAISYGLGKWKRT